MKENEKGQYFQEKPDGQKKQEYQNSIKQSENYKKEKYKKHSNQVEDEDWKEKGTRYYINNSFLAKEDLQKKSNKKVKKSAFGDSDEDYSIITGKDISSIK